MERRDLEGLSREELIAQAEALGVPRPRVLTQAELMDELLARSAQGEPERARSRGFLGRARGLLTRVVERGLHLPETARALRTAPPQGAWPPPPPPFPTITLAEIYAGQGHVERAIAVLDDVLAREPSHEDARALRARLVEKLERVRVQHPSVPPANEQPAAAESAADEPADDQPAEAATADGDADPDARVASSELQPVEPSTSASAEGRAPAEASPPPTGHEAALREAVAGGTQDDVAELPGRYDLDEIVGMAVDPGTIYLYWEVRPTTLARARARRPEGRLAIRLVTVLPSWDGPIVAQRDMVIDALFGDMFVHDVPAGSNVRMSTGWLTGDPVDTRWDAASPAPFEPFSVGSEVAAPRVLPSEAPPPAVVPFVEEVAAADARAEHLHRVGAPQAIAVLEGAAAIDIRARAWQATEAPRFVSTPWRATEAAPRAALRQVAGARAPSVGAAGARGAAAQGEPEESPPLAEGPPRFPSGTVPTAVSIARAVAATRGGSSELSRAPGHADLVSPFLLVR